MEIVQNNAERKQALSHFLLTGAAPLLLTALCLLLFYPLSERMPERQRAAAECSAAMLREVAQLDSLASLAEARLLEMSGKTTESARLKSEADGLIALARSQHASLMGRAKKPVACDLEWHSFLENYRLRLNGLGAMTAAMAKVAREREQGQEYAAVLHDQRSLLSAQASFLEDLDRQLNAARNYLSNDNPLSGASQIEAVFTLMREEKRRVEGLLLAAPAGGLSLQTDY